MKKTFIFLAQQIRETSEAAATQRRLSDAAFKLYKETGNIEYYNTAYDANDAAEKHKETTRHLRAALCELCAALGCRLSPTEREHPETIQPNF